MSKLFVELLFFFTGTRRWPIDRSSWEVEETNEICNVHLRVLEHNDMFGEEVRVRS